HVRVRVADGPRRAVRTVVSDDDARVEPGGRLAGRRDGLQRQLARVVADDDHDEVEYVHRRASAGGAPAPRRPAARTTRLTAVPSSARSTGPASRREPG